MTPEALTTHLATTLKTNTANAVMRAVLMKLTPACGRCVGSGHYSFNQVHGTTCFGCNGAGHVKPKNKAERVECAAEADRAAVDGRLDAYLTYRAIVAQSKNAMDKMFSAWEATGISKAYDWNKATVAGRDRDISQINGKIADAQKALSKVIYSKHDDAQSKALAIYAALQEALAITDLAKIELDQYLEANA